jgi:hypothetical protein
MQRALTVGLALVCVCLLFAMSGPAAQRAITGDSGGGTAPVPVAVNNFPAVQTVQGNVAVDKTVTITGTVAVTNLPAVQQVVGVVNVGNLPVDAFGRLIVSVQSSGSGALTLRSTSATFPGVTGGDLLATERVLSGSRATLRTLGSTISSTRRRAWLAAAIGSSFSHTHRG